MALAPSVNATAPASSSSPSSAISSPRQPRVSAAYGRMVRLPVSSPRERSSRTRAGSSIAGRRVGQGGQGGDAAGGRRLGGGGDGLAVLVAGLAQRRPHVDEAGAQHRAVGVDQVRAVGPRDPAAEIGDPAVADQQRAHFVPVGRRVDQARVDEQEIGHGGVKIRRGRGRSPDAMARSGGMPSTFAVRTATWGGAAAAVYKGKCPNRRDRRESAGRRAGRVDQSGAWTSRACG